MKQTIFKTMFSTLLTGIIVTGTVFAFTNTVPHKQDNQVVSAAEWNTIKTTIDNLQASVNLGNYYTKNEATNKFIDAGDLTACKTGEVAKMTNTGFICVKDNGGVDAYSKTESDSKYLATANLTACKTGEVAKITSNGFTCVTDQIGDSAPDIPSCGSSQYLTTENGNLKCKNLPSSSTGGGLQCPPYKLHVNDTTKGNDEYLSYKVCTPTSSVVIFTLPHILDDAWNSSDDERYMADQEKLWKLICNQFWYVYHRHTTQDYYTSLYIKYRNNYYEPYEFNDNGTSTIMNHLYCKPGEVNINDNFSSGGGWSTGIWTGDTEVNPVDD